MIRQNRKRIFFLASTGVLGCLLLFSIVGKAGAQEQSYFTQWVDFTETKATLKSEFKEVNVSIETDPSSSTELPMYSTTMSSETTQTIEGTEKQDSASISTSSTMNDEAY